MPLPLSALWMTGTLAPASAACCKASAYTLRSTNRRVGALQLWPVLLMHLFTLKRTALSTLLSANRMLGDLPPNSCTTRLTVSAACLATEMPAAVEPVKEIKSTSGWLLSIGPMWGPSPYNRLKTPAG